MRSRSRAELLEVGQAARVGVEPDVQPARVGEDREAEPEPVGDRHDRVDRLDRAPAQEARLARPGHVGGDQVRDAHDPSCAPAKATSAGGRSSSRCSSESMPVQAARASAAR